MDKATRRWRPGDADPRPDYGFGYGPTTGTQVTQAIHRMRRCEMCGGSGHAFNGPIWNPCPTCPVCGGMGFVVAGASGEGKA